MAVLDAKTIKKLKTGELIGNIATALCGVTLIYFAVCFALSWTRGDTLWQTVTWATAAPLMLIFVAVAAFCNLKYGGEIDRTIKKYVQDVCVENAALMHPEKNSLSFYVNMEQTNVELTVNGYKEKIVFDFSAFGRLGSGRKLTVLSAIDARICTTFCKLYERGADYKNVDYREKDGLRRKSGKVVPIIKDGVPDERAMKFYLKNK